MATETRRRRRRHPVVAPGPRERARLELTGVAHGGEAIGRLEGRVVFVPYGLPGEVVDVELHDDKRDYARGEIVDVVQASPERIEPPCPYFGSCGGCQWQHASYAAQLRFKQEIVAEQLRRIGHFEDAARYVLPTIGMADPWHYRNHVRFSVGRRDGELCFTRHGTRSLLRIDHCWISHPRINEIVGQLQGRFVGQRLHQLVIRVGANTGDLLISPAVPQAPEVPSGQAELEEELLGRRFQVVPHAFFQVNTRREPRVVQAEGEPSDGSGATEPPASSEAGDGDLPPGLSSPLVLSNPRLAELVPEDGLSIAEVLILVALDRLAPRPDDIVVDAYCGVGTFAAIMAPLVREVVGIEEATAAVGNARDATRDLPNVRFVAGKTEDVLPKLEERPNKVLLDPARVGCDPAVLEALLAARPERIVYVSCEPATLARDLAILRDGGYTLRSVQPVDMFPQTSHIESVSLLAR